jgi:AraC-like DNA-binding protein
MKYYGLELIEQLCGEFGPSGCCDPIRKIIIEQIVDVVDAYCVDRVGNIVAKLCGGGESYDAKHPGKVLLCTGMDEVGLIVKRVSDKGHLNFAPIGDIDPRVLGGKSLLVGDGTRAIKGIVASKAIHLQSAEERRRLTPVRKMYIDIGAEDAEQAQKYVDVGCVAVFDSAFERFGEEKAFMSAKALESRLGCAALIELLRMNILGPSSLSKINGIIDYIKEHFSENITNKHLSNVFGYHPYHLNRIMKSAIGTTLHQYLIYYRMEMAKKFLGEAELSVLEISRLCGYNNFSNFSYDFKKKNGCTPLGYREKSRKR